MMEKIIFILLLLLALPSCTADNLFGKSDNPSKYLVDNPDILVAGEGPSFWDYSYNGQVPGPLLTGVVGETLNITVYNNLTQPTTVHWHGLRLENEFDGVPGVTQDPINPQERFVYQLKLQDSGLYWYHPHVNTPEQLERGLFGTILVTDPNDPIDSDLEEIIVLDDVKITNGKIGPFVDNVTYYSMHGRFGNRLLINGKNEEVIYAPENGLLRLRIVNVANARTFYFGIEDHKILVLGRDIGLGEYAIEQPYVEISPGQRYDLLIYLNQEMKSYNLLSLSSRGSTSLGKIIYEDSKNNREEAYQEYQHMKLANYPDWNLGEPNHTIELYGEIKEGKLIWTLNGKIFPEQPELTELETGKYYQIRFKNLQGQVHPMHLHGQKFIVLARDGEKPIVKQWLDTVLVGSRETVDIGFIADKGSWIQHCHILEHAEVGMTGIMEIN